MDFVRKSALGGREPATALLRRQAINRRGEDYIQFGILTCRQFGEEEGKIGFGSAGANELPHAID